MTHPITADLNDRETNLQFKPKSTSRGGGNMTDFADFSGFWGFLLKSVIYDRLCRFYRKFCRAAQNFEFYPPNLS